MWRSGVWLQTQDGGRKKHVNLLRGSWLNMIFIHLKHFAQICGDLFFSWRMLFFHTDLKSLPQIRKIDVSRIVCWKQHLEQRDTPKSFFFAGYSLQMFKELKHLLFIFLFEEHHNFLKFFFFKLKVFQSRSIPWSRLALQDRDALPDKYFIEGEPVVIVHPLRGQKTGTVANPNVNWSLGLFFDTTRFFFFWDVTFFCGRPIPMCVWIRGGANKKTRFFFGRCVAFLGWKKTVGLAKAFFVGWKIQQRVHLGLGIATLWQKWIQASSDVQ